MIHIIRNNHPFGCSGSQIHHAETGGGIRGPRLGIPLFLELGIYPLRSGDWKHGDLRLVKAQVRNPTGFGTPPEGTVPTSAAQYLFVIHPGSITVQNHITAIRGQATGFPRIQTCNEQVATARESHRFPVRRKLRILHSAFTRIQYPPLLTFHGIYHQSLVSNQTDGSLVRGGIRHGLYPDLLPDQSGMGHGIEEYPGFTTSGIHREDLGPLELQIVAGIDPFNNPRQRRHQPSAIFHIGLVKAENIRIRPLGDRDNTEQNQKQNTRNFHGSLRCGSHNFAGFKRDLPAICMDS